MGYVLSAGLWTGIGVAFYAMKDSQEQLTEKRVAALMEARAKRLEENN